MSQNAPSRGSPVDPALAATPKRPTRAISEPSNFEDTTLAYLRNAAVGMALSYLERVDVILKPVWFSVRHLGIVFAAMIHMGLPMVGAWFASHWSERMEQAVWDGSALNQGVNFFLLWVAALMTWSLVWLTVRAILVSAGKALGSLNATGDADPSPLVLRERSNPGKIKSR